VKNAELQNAECKMQNAECKMQNAELRIKSKCNSERSEESKTAVV
jgi:Tfp pilus assembly protein PilX